MHLTAERLRELLDYNPVNGVFTWKDPCPQGRRVGDVAGSPDCKDGYWKIGLDMRQYRSARLAWLYMTGEWPEGVIDHINGDPADDRFANLRPASQLDNRANSAVSSHNTSGFKGVNFHKRVGRWRATIQREKKHIHIGYFDSAEEAHAAYMKKASELFGEFARTG